MGKNDMRRTVNVKLENGQRRRIYCYFEKKDKEWLKEKAQQKGISVSKYIHDLVKEQIENDIRLDLDVWKWLDV